MSVSVARRQLLSEPTRLAATILAIAAATAAGGSAALRQDDVGAP